MSNNPVNEVTQLFVPEHPAKQNNTLTLDLVFNELEVWRSKKTNRTTAIPDYLWEKIFELAERISPTKLKAIMGVTHAQYLKKQDELYPLSSNVPDNANTTPNKKIDVSDKVDFCQLKTTDSLYKPLDALATHTIVVEFHRSDGQLMKIHTVNSNFKTLIQLFYENGKNASDHL